MSRFDRGVADGKPDGKTGQTTQPARTLRLSSRADSVRCSILFVHDDWGQQPIYLSFFFHIFLFIHDLFFDPLPCDSMSFACQNASQGTWWPPVKPTDLEDSLNRFWLEKKAPGDHRFWSTFHWFWETPCLSQGRR